MRVIRLDDSMDDPFVGGRQDGEQNLLNVQVAAYVAYGMVKQAVRESLLEHIGFCCVRRDTEMLQHCLNLFPD